MIEFKLSYGVRLLAVGHDMSDFELDAKEMERVDAAGTPGYIMVA